METVQGANWIDTDGNTTTIESIFRDGGMDAVRLRCVRPSLPMTLASH
jgi:hypothetical protein